jgi:RNA polymerase sigma-70 factor (ECF subfamily)
LGDDDAGNKAVVDDLIRTYWKPVYCYLRQKGYGNEDAKDLTQGFFHEVVLGRKLIQRADHRKGRFRTLLLTALDRYLTSAHRRRTAQKRTAGSRLVPLEHVDIAALPEPVGKLSSEEFFNYAWISELLDRMLEAVEAECLQRGMAVHWDLFYDRVLHPILECAEPPSLESLCRKHRIDSTVKVSNMIFAVKRRFQASAKRLLRQSVASEDDFSEEMLELVKFLAKGRQY